MTGRPATPLPPGPWAVERHAVGYVVYDAAGRVIASTDDRSVADGVARLPDLLRERGEEVPESALMTAGTLTLLTMMFGGKSAEVRSH